MGDDMPMWKGLFEWSMSYQDGTTNTGPSSTRPLTEEDRQWLEQALRGAMLDLSSRMQDISVALNEPVTETPQIPSSDSPNSQSTPSITPLEDKERMLDELMEIVESIDQAKDLSTVGGLQTLLTLLSSPHPSLRWRAAEVVATCVQNNPDVQDAFLEGGVLPALWPLLDVNGGGGDAAEGTTTDVETTALATGQSSALCQVKGMLAVSCQIRGHPASLQWFRENNGVKKIVEILLKSEDARVQRKCLQLLGYILNTVPGDCQSAISINITEGETVEEGTGSEVQSSLLSVLVRLIADSDDGDIRSAALGVVRQLARDDICVVEMRKESSGVVEAVQAVQCKLDSLPKEEWGPAEEEAKLSVVVMEELFKKKVFGGGSSNIANSVPSSSVEGERSGSMQLMALPDQE